ncbi:DUF4145 domain-containing protein [bacterium]|nr:DUF4145 domain-containing protein [bacterium]
MSNVGDEIQAQCPKCGPDINVEIKSKYGEGVEEGDIYGTIHYFVLKCKGCNYFFIQKITWCDEYAKDEDIEYWPALLTRPRPKWLNEMDYKSRHLKEVLLEVYGAIESKLLILSAIGIRTSFDVSSELLGIDANKKFVEKLNDLETTGKISASEKKTLSILVDIGNAAAHRAFRPTLDEISRVMDVLEGFVSRTFIHEIKMKELEVRIPPRVSKKKGSSI